MHHQIRPEVRVSHPSFLLGKTFSFRRKCQLRKDSNVHHTSSKAGRYKWKWEGTLCPAGHQFSFFLFVFFFLKSIRSREQMFGTIFSSIYISIQLQMSSLSNPMFFLLYKRDQEIFPSLCFVSYAITFGNQIRPAYLLIYRKERDFKIPFAYHMDPRISLVLSTSHLEY